MSDDTLTTADLLCGSPRDGITSKACVLALNHNGDHITADGQTWFNRGPLQSYEITWMSGHVETVPAHRMSYQGDWVQLYADVNGRLQLMLSALASDIRTMRNVTDGERLS